jgi:hypothetical protein
MNRLAVGVQVGSLNGGEVLQSCWDLGVVSDEEEGRRSGLCCLVVGVPGSVDFAFMVVSRNVCSDKKMKVK